MTKKTENNWEKLFNKQQTQALKGERRLELIDNYFFIYDCIQNCAMFTSNAYDIITGYESHKFDFPKLTSMIHPDDLAYFFNCEDKCVSFTNRLSYTEHFQYIFNYTFRMITSTGEVITIEQSRQAMEVDLNGNLSKTLVSHKRISNKEVRDVDDFKIFDKRLNGFINENSYFKFTKRELEIISLVKIGMSSMDIARKLNISKLTIDTHRKKILSKSNCSNFLELYRRMSFFEAS